MSSKHETLGSFPRSESPVHAGAHLQSQRQRQEDWESINKALSQEEMVGERRGRTVGGGGRGGRDGTRDGTREMAQQFRALTVLAEAVPSAHSHL